MISITNLEKKFGRKPVLNRISFSTAKGSIIAVIGPNGSGKSTLIKCILGLVKLDSGSISVNDIEVNSDWQYRKYIGYMPQISRFPEFMKTRQLFEMMKDIRNNPGELDLELFEKYALSEIGDKRLGILSGGTKQKVSAALALLFSPLLLILDEPTASLDPIATDILKEKIIREKKNGKTVLITSHNMNEVEELADCVAYMEDGRMKFCMSVEQLKTNTNETKLSKAVSKQISES